MIKTNKHIAVIGAGVAGLASAARLANKGFKVTLYEKNDYPGGKIGSLTINGYTFDTGPSLFTQPYLLEELFSSCGRKLTDYLPYRQLTTGTNHFYEDGTVLTSCNNRTIFGNELRVKLGIDPAPAFNFLDEVKEMYLKIGLIFLDEPIHHIKTWTTSQIPVALKQLKRAYLLETMHAYHKQCLNHPKLVQLFDRFATYNGSDPYQAPAMLCMIAHLEMNEGIFYPEGGMINIANALYKLCIDLGVTFHFNSTVDRITISYGKTTGIVCNKEEAPTDVVISNSDVYYTYKNLLQDETLAGRINKQERSSSGVIFYWGINRPFPQLTLHNILFAEDYQAEFNSLFNLSSDYPDPTVYINITSKIDTEHAPPGCENWFVLVNTPPSAINDPAQTERIRQAVIAKVNRILKTDITQYITTERVLTPHLIDCNTGSYMGALYGTSSNNKMAAFLRQANVSSKYKGLFFAGGTAHPGGGIPLCLRSAKLACEQVVKIYG